VGPDTPRGSVRSLDEKPDTPDGSVRYFDEKPDTPGGSVRSLDEKPDTPGGSVRSFDEKPDTPDGSVRSLDEKPDTPDGSVRPLTRDPYPLRERSLPHAQSRATRRRMGQPIREDMGDLLVRSQMALHMLQNELAEFLGVSDRTMRRWVSGGVHLIPSTLLTLTSAVHEKDPALAARIAAAHGETLEGLGLGLAPDQQLVHTMVKAAAEVAQVSTRAMRPALAAALERGRAAGLTMEAAHSLLAGDGGGKSGKNKKG
jgi:hypothetical protein